MNTIDEINMKKKGQANEIFPCCRPTITSGLNVLFTQ